METGAAPRKSAGLLNHVGAAFLGAADRCVMLESCVGVVSADAG
jgi:hypothetical protein